MFDMFSLAEKDVIKIIGRKKMTINDITQEYFKDKDAPFEANNYVGGVIRRIVAKCEHYGLNWTIEGEGAGRGGRTVWRAPR